MASKDTGFHPSDPDWTRGRSQAVADAEAIARRKSGMAREVAMTKIARLGQEWDAAHERAGMPPDDRAPADKPGEWG